MTTDATAESVPVAEGLFSWPDQPRLIGSMCEACGTTTFPSQQSCPRCTGTELRQAPLATTGRLWTWTIQAFEPKPPYSADGPFEHLRRRVCRAGHRGRSRRGAGRVPARPRLTPAGCRSARTMKLAFVPLRRDRGRRAGRDLRLRARQRRGPVGRQSRSEPTVDVAIVGIGIHPFGRHPGVSGRAQGAYAAGRRWRMRASAGPTSSAHSAEAWPRAAPTRSSATSA